jgi:hypothetical protein
MGDFPLCCMGINIYCGLLSVCRHEYFPQHSMYITTFFLLTIESGIYFFCQTLSDSEWKFIHICHSLCKPKVGGPQISSANRKSANNLLKKICAPSANVAMCGFAIWEPNYFLWTWNFHKSANTWLADWYGTTTTTLCRSWLYPPVRDLWIRLLDLQRWEVETAAFAERDRKHTMIDLRGIST